MSDAGGAWGPWIDHDGAGVPGDLEIGQLVCVTSEDNTTGDLIEDEAFITAAHLAAFNWIWGQSSHDTLRYRIWQGGRLSQMDRAADVKVDA